MLVTMYETLRKKGSVSVLHNAVTAAPLGDCGLIGCIIFLEPELYTAATQIDCYTIRLLHRTST
jgi:hypothetical protein